MIQDLGTMTEAIAALNGVPAQIFPAFINGRTCRFKRIRTAVKGHLHLTPPVEAVDQVGMPVFCQMGNGAAQRKIDAQSEPIVFDKNHMCII